MPVNEDRSDGQSLDGDRSEFERFEAMVKKVVAAPKPDRGTSLFYPSRPTAPTFAGRFADPS